MADDIAIWHIVTAPWDAMQVDLDRASDRATMYGLRAVGRAVRAAARAQAPVYKGNDPRVVSGELKRSIKSSRRLTSVGSGTYSMTVMPTGNKKQGTAVRRTSSGGLRGVPLYRRQMEQKYGYMRAGINVANADAVRIFEDAYKIAFAKWAP
jgi:hypothetical protein